jgi:hypothetical protein
MTSQQKRAGLHAICVCGRACFISGSWLTMRMRLMQPASSAAPRDSFSRCTSSISTSAICNELGKKLSRLAAHAAACLAERPHCDQVNVLLHVATHIAEEGHASLLLSFACQGVCRRA